MNLFPFLNKKVELIYEDGTKYVGVVTHHTIPGDNDPEEQSISFIPNSGIMKGQTAEVMEHEIISIKVID